MNTKFKLNKTNYSKYFDVKDAFYIHNREILYPARVSISESGVNFFCSDGYNGPRGRVFIKTTVREFQDALIPMSEINKYLEYLI